MKKVRVFIEISIPNGTINTFAFLLLFAYFGQFQFQTVQLTQGDNGLQLHHLHGFQFQTVQLTLFSNKIINF